MPTVTIEQAVEIARTHHQSGRLTEAEGIYRQILAQQPDQPDALHLLGVLVYQRGQADAAIELIRRAIAIAPSVAEFHSNLSVILRDIGQIEAAIAASQQAIEIKPDYADAYNNLSSALRDQGKHEKALAALRRAIHLNPDLSEAHNNLGNLLKEQGQIEEAIAAYDRAIALKPDNPVFASNRLFVLHLHPEYSAQAIYEAHQHWNQQYAAPLKPRILPHPNDRSLERRLKIGFVSPDLRSNPVGRFLLPLLENHDYSQFHITGYADVFVPTAMTHRLSENTDAWRSTVGLSHEQLADLIRADGIDILVDLTMHSANNRLLVFARQPAPVQVTYLAYCSTTGLDAMDYRLTDPYLDPPGSELDGEADSLYLEIYSERSVWLPQTYWCYQAPDGVPNVGPLPALSAGHITFGCLNNFSKVNDGALSAWCALLRAVPGSRLLLHAGEGSHRQRVSDFLEREEVDVGWVSFAEYMPLREYFGLYGKIDIALDPFPWAGGTTTCDALWMGVPVVSLAGATAVSRGGLSILSNVGLPELVARTPEQYVDLASELAADRARLAGLRSSLRERMLGSPLMDAPGFTCAVEAAYRQMWHNWCEAK